MKIAVVATAVLILLILGIWAMKESRLEHDALEYRIREWGGTEARRIYAETADTIAAKMAREELIEQWQALRV